ncbi:vesicle-associated membrane protein 3 [Trichinella spiralis]|uniref:vesicle-associated membrane protein 3 n=1 Tax=Trichinella spiralis TaxID=6334 RepID=UPI0001EFCF41|nr:vesicle-associated membrane protein 3 [Trichinella spiralis]
MAVFVYLGKLQYERFAEQLSQPNFGVTDGQAVAQGRPQSKRLQQTQAQVDEVVGIMKVNVEKVLERDAKLSQLDDRADALQEGASQFEKSAATLKHDNYHLRHCADHNYHHCRVGYEINYTRLLSVCDFVILKIVSVVYRVVSCPLFSCISPCVSGFRRRIKQKKKTFKVDFQLINGVPVTRL